ncbi:MAG: hypothetical protein M3081_20755, partial [Gemmatimonadota bacterium]|nr:hypothetical protein [Gemmatimonadota bacterium]
MQLTPVSPSISVSGTVTMIAVPLDQNGTLVAGATPASFTTSDATKATVDATTGVVTGVAVGTPSITASITSAGTTKTAAQTVTVSAITNSTTITGTGTNTWSPQNAQVSAVATVQWVLNGNHSVIFDTGPGALPS